MRYPQGPNMEETMAGGTYVAGVRVYMPEDLANGQEPQYTMPDMPRPSLPGIPATYNQSYEVPPAFAQVPTYPANQPPRDARDLRGLGGLGGGGLRGLAALRAAPALGPLSSLGLGGSSCGCAGTQGFGALGAQEVVIFGKDAVFSGWGARAELDQPWSYPFLDDRTGKGLPMWEGDEYTTKWTDAEFKQKAQKNVLSSIKHGWWVRHGGVSFFPDKRVPLSGADDPVLVPIVAYLQWIMYGGDKTKITGAIGGSGDAAHVFMQDLLWLVLSGIDNVRNKDLSTLAQRILNVFVWADSSISYGRNRIARFWIPAGFYYSTRDAKIETHHMWQACWYGNKPYGQAAGRYGEHTTGTTTIMGQTSETTTTARTRTDRLQRQGASLSCSGAGYPADKAYDMWAVLPPRSLPCTVPQVDSRGHIINRAGQRIPLPDLIFEGTKRDDTATKAMPNIEPAANTDAYTKQVIQNVKEAILNADPGSYGYLLGNTGNWTEVRNRYEQNLVRAIAASGEAARVNQEIADAPRKQKEREQKTQISSLTAERNYLQLQSKLLSNIDKFKEAKTDEARAALPFEETGTGPRSCGVWFDAQVANTLNNVKDEQPYKTKLKRLKNKCARLGPALGSLQREKVSPIAAALDEQLQQLQQGKGAAFADPGTCRSWVAAQFTNDPWLKRNESKTAGQRTKMQGACDGARPLPPAAQVAQANAIAQGGGGNPEIAALLAQMQVDREADEAAEAAEREAAREAAAAEREAAAAEREAEAAEREAERKALQAQLEEAKKLPKWVIPVGAGIGVLALIALLRK